MIESLVQSSLWQSAHLRDFIETVNFSRRIERSSASVESVSFNINWAIDQSLFQAAINFFAQDIQQFQTSETYLIWHNQQYSITFSFTFINKSRIKFTEEVTITNSQNVITASFTEVQQETLNWIIIESVSRTIQKLSNQDDLSFESFKSLESTDSTDLADDDDENNHHNHWNSTEVRFFDSMYNDKFMHIDDSLKHSDKKTYFQDVHLFIECIKNILHIKDVNLVRTNLWIYLQDTAMKWYIKKLIDDEKRLIKYEDDVNEWIHILIKRFCCQNRV